MTQQTEHFKRLLEKYPDRRIQTLDRMRALLASHCLARGFGESMEAYYMRNPQMKETDDGIQNLIIEYGGLRT